MSERKIGDLLDQLNVTGFLRDDDLISDAMVICKVIDSDGDVQVMLAASESLTWLDQFGLLAAAKNICEDTKFQHRSDDE